MATYRLVEAMKKAYEADSKINAVTSKLAGLNVTSHDIEWTPPAADGLFKIFNPKDGSQTAFRAEEGATGILSSQLRLYGSAGDVTARVNGDGDVHGTAWGGWLSAKLSGMNTTITNVNTDLENHKPRINHAYNCLVTAKAIPEGFSLGGNDPRVEWHVPAVAARMFYLSTDGIFRLAVSNGTGGSSGIICQWSGNNLYNNGDIEAAGNVIAFSDQKLKKDIKKTGGLHAVSKLEGVEWVWKKTGDVGAGLIAQDVQEVLPSAIKVCEDETLGLNYNAVIGLLVNAVNELRQQVEELQCQING